MKYSDGMRSKSVRSPRTQRTRASGPVQRIASYALLVRDESLLLCRLSGNVRPAGFWTLPGGGVEFGEHPEQAVIREVKEETGFDVVTTGLAGVDSMVYHYPGPPRHAIRLLFFVKIVGGEMRHETNGSTDRCEFIDRKEADKLQLVDLAQRGMDIALGKVEK